MKTLSDILNISDNLITDLDFARCNYTTLFIIRRLCSSLLKLLNDYDITDKQMMLIIQEIYDTALQSSLIR